MHPSKVYPTPYKPIRQQPPTSCLTRTTAWAIYIIHSLLLDTRQTPQEPRLEYEGTWLEIARIR